MEHPASPSDLIHKYKKSLQISWKEGIPANFMLVMIDHYLTPLALFLGASTKQIGFLIAIPQILSSITLLFAARIVKAMGNQLVFLVRTAALQAFLLIPIALLAFSSHAHRVEILIVLVTVFRIVGNLIGTVWQGLMSHYLPPEERGKYMGWRAQIQGLAGIVAVIAGGIILSVFKNFRMTSVGFFVLFVIMAGSRFLSGYLMSRMQNIEISHSREHDFTFLMFLRRFRQSNFVKFVFFVAATTFTTSLASPYYNVYLLRDLHFNYFQYMLVNLAVVVCSLISFPIWGRHADHVGNAKVLKVTSLMIPLIPFAWLWTKSVLGMILIEMYAGFVWGGFNLCSVNYIYDAVTPGKRIRCLSYFNLINGAALFLGASLGGWLAEHLPPLQGNSLLSLFLLSAVLRFASHFFLAHHFQEVRKTSHKVSSLDLFFGVFGIKPCLGRDIEMNFFSMMKKPKWLGKS